MNQNTSLLAPFYLIAATLIGLGDTLFLSYYQFLNLIPSCAIGGCEIVLTSAYSKVFGIPLSYIGLVYYVYMLALLALLVVDPKSKGLRWGVLLYATVGLLHSIAFEGIQLSLIGALCMYCGISALVTLVLFCLALWHFRATKNA